MFHVPRILASNVEIGLRFATPTYVRDRGIAKATPDDCFNIHIGKAIALRRALGLAVPDEYLNAPQPTEVRVGDFVSDDSGVNKALVIEDDSWPPFSGGRIPPESRTPSPSAHTQFRPAL